MNVLLRIIYKTILYTSPVWLFFFYLEYRLSSLENSYSFKIKNFNKVKDSCKVLVLGNSEMLKGVNPDFLPQPAFNMAHVSQNFIVDEQIMQKYLPQLPQLKIVILGLSYLSFGDDLESGEEAWRVAFYKKYYHLNLKSGLDLKDYSYTLRYTPYESLKMCMKNFKADLINGMQTNGWMKTDSFDAKDLTDESAKQKAEMHTRNLKEKNVEMNVRALRNILMMLKEKHIKVLIIAPPVMRNYYQNLNTYWLAKNDSILNSITGEFNPVVINFAEANDSLYTTFQNGFNDENHLNKNGADRLGILLREIFNKN